MEITEVGIRLAADQNERLRAFCYIVIDGSFVISDLKIVQGAKRLFVAMPSRRRTFHCPRCSVKNHLTAHYCSECGFRFAPQPNENGEPQRLFFDVAHPISNQCREMISERVLSAYQKELELAQNPDYRPSHAEFFGPDEEPPA
ncbi:MAG: SpoVG family protein [Thermoguttaceae bacterium]|nr:SpoVG family protein [Thermoguttaceae bacterium]MBO7722815.1 SpoVG family protein [Thermoguttaceae bacterium]MBQ2684205.1 SpoVG family protein [Thermoguttaceae bacterium]MBQ6620049.1 SpoVG family protein [Thermoguttaceae bacterium]